MDDRKETSADLSLPSRGEIWQHYKGHLYEVVGLGNHTESGAVVVIYRRFDHNFASRDADYPEDGDLFVRPLDIFLGRTNDHERRFQWRAADRAAWR